jgi:Family of unknown function (DUF5985)
VTTHTVTFLWGALTMACGVTALLFLRFWRLSRDRLLIYFAAAFAALSLNWLLLGLIDPGEESRHYAYFVRLLGFALILAGIFDKNRRQSRGAR